MTDGPSAARGPGELSEVVPAALGGERLDRFVAMLTGLPRGEVAEMVASGQVQVGGRAVTTRSRRVVEGEVVTVQVPVPAEAYGGPQGDPAVDFVVVHEDDGVIVVDKPAGLVVHPGAGHQEGTLAHGLLSRYPEIEQVGERDRPGIVHRLDRGTSGLLVVARTEEARVGLVEALAARLVERRYQALVWGHPEPAQGLVDAPVGRSRRDPTKMAVTATGKEARTGYEVSQRYLDGPSALLDLKLETGRTHQIRVHLAAISHPVVGDERYGGRRAVIPVGRPFLHAVALSFDHPLTGERLSFSSSLPDDLRRVLDGLQPLLPG